MRKLISSLIALAMVTTMFTACGNGNVEIDPDAEQNLENETVGQVEVEVGGEDWGEDETLVTEDGERTNVDISGAEAEVLGEKFSPEIQPDGTLDEQSAAKVRRAIIESLKGKESYDVDTELTCTLRLETPEEDDLVFEDHPCSQTSHSTYDGEKAHIELDLVVDGVSSNIEAYYEFGKNFMPYKNADNIQVWSIFHNPYSDSEAHWYTMKKAAPSVTGVITPITAEFINKMERTTTSLPDETQVARLTKLFAERNGEVVEEDTSETTVEAETATDEDGNIIEVETTAVETTEETTEAVTDTTEESAGGIKFKDIDSGSVSVGDGDAALEKEKENPIDGIYQFSGVISARWLGDVTFSGLGLDTADTTFMEDNYIVTDVLYNANTNEIVSVYMDMSKLVGDAFNSFIDRIPNSMDDTAGRYTVRDYIYSMNFNNYNNTEEIEIPEDVTENALKDTDLGINKSKSSIFIYF